MSCRALAEKLAGKRATSGQQAGEGGYSDMAEPNIAENAYICKNYFRNMADNDWKRRLGVVYSTNPDFSFTEQEEESVETLEPSAQKLIVSIDRRNRGGKQVTLVTGFIGSEEDLAGLGRTLKVKCGVGGSAKNGEITIQGDFRDKVTEILRSMGYKAKRGN